MKLVSLIFWLWWFVLALASCGDGHPAASGNCDDGAACDCSAGRSGSAVCDVDTRVFIMCRCDTPTQRLDADADAGSDRPRTGAAGSGGDPAHRTVMPASDGGKTAAADGGRMAEAADAGGDDGNQDGDAAGGKGTAGHSGKALGHTKGHGQAP